MTSTTGSADHHTADAPSHDESRGRRIALVGNPNTGKSTLFNRLCGIRTRTANVPGSTVEARMGVATIDGERCDIIDLPGHYGLNLDRPESRICREYLRGDLPGVDQPDAVVIVVDTTNLVRNLVFVSQAVQQGVPAVIALNMIDLAQRGGLTVDAERLSEAIGCPVVPMCARSGDGVDDLGPALAQAELSDAALPDPTDAQRASEWAERVVAGCVGGDRAVGATTRTLTDRLDAAFTHPVLGIVVFASIMTFLFMTIFWLSSVPMDLIDVIFGFAGEQIGTVLPDGAIRSLVVDGVIAGIAGTVVFLPQICLLFFLISVLEDTGYLARAAFVMDRMLRWFGLPGQAFVPMLSAHACAIPAIMSTRLIPDPKDRLATILVTPFLSCAARLPVYVLLIGFLFADQPVYAGLAFTGCYLLGALAAVLSALLARRTLLRGPSRPMVLELPTYKLPSLRTALLMTWDRAVVFIKKAGTVIVVICMVLWWLGEYPHVDPPAAAIQLEAEASQVEASDADQAVLLREDAARLAARHAAESSFSGRIGHLIEPIFAPLGYDWQLSVGVVSSLLAREVFVSTMTVVVAGSDDAEDETVIEQLMNARRNDGEPLFTTATAVSLLVYYVLAMQCLPTLAVTRRETGSWRWAALQLVWMTGIAYVLALIVHQAFKLAGVA